MLGQTYRRFSSDTMYDPMTKQPVRNFDTGPGCWVYRDAGVVTVVRSNKVNGAMEYFVLEILGDGGAMYWEGLNARKIAMRMAKAFAPPAAESTSEAKPDAA